MPRISSFKANHTFSVVCVFTLQTDEWCVHNRLFNANLEEKFKHPIYYVTLICDEEKRNAAKLALTHFAVLVGSEYFFSGCSLNSKTFYSYYDITTVDPISTMENQINVENIYYFFNPPPPGGTAILPEYIHYYGYYYHYFDIFSQITYLR
jgi:hypothetical protein